MRSFFEITGGIVLKGARSIFEWVFSTYSEPIAEQAANWAEMACIGEEFSLPGHTITCIEF